MHTVVISTKDLSSRGGVANYYRIFFKGFRSSQFRLALHIVGSRSKDYYGRLNRKTGYLFDFLLDLIKLIALLQKDRSITIIQVNPSLTKIPLLRDGLIIVLAKIFRKKVVVFYRGWKDDFLGKLGSSKMTKFWFKYFYQKADANIFLAYKFPKQLAEAGIKLKGPYITRTIFCRDDLDGISKCYSDSRVSFIFISRISKKKGVEEIIHATHKLVSIGKKLIVNIHGHFVNMEYKSQIYSLVAELGLKDIVLIGPYVDGKGKYNELSNSDIFLLPSYEEGCPNSVIEAMASGCFIISSDAGALPEIVQDGINGLILYDITVDNLAAKMEYAIDNIESVREIGKNNIKYAFDNFEAESHIIKMENLYRSLV